MKPPISITVRSSKENATKGKSKNKGKLRSIHVETAENGVSITPNRESPETKFDAYRFESPKPHLATTHEEAMDHIGALLAEHLAPAKKAAKETPAEEKSESAAKQQREEDEGEEDD